MLVSRALPMMVLLVLAGCQSDMRDLENYVADVKGRPAPPLDPLPVMKQFESFVYNARELRDPFALPQEKDAEVARVDGPRPDPDRPKQPLEKIPLDSIKWGGWISSTVGFYGLVLDPERRLHFVTPGSYLGQSDGRVLEVRADGLEIVELVPDGNGNWMERPARLALENE
ncbi:MAG: pilus assembly protein PilP [Aquimonas sp.]|nr:pilus assembly protein PilP [Aquimonas sp.]